MNTNIVLLLAIVSTAHLFGAEKTPTRKELKDALQHKIQVQRRNRESGGVIFSSDRARNTGDIRRAMERSKELDVLAKGLYTPTSKFPTQLRD